MLRVTLDFYLCLENGGTQLNGSVVGAVYFVDGEGLTQFKPYVV